MVPPLLFFTILLSGGLIGVGVDVAVGAGVDYVVVTAFVEEDCCCARADGPSGNAGGSPSPPGGGGGATAEGSTEARDPLPLALSSWFRSWVCLSTSWARWSGLDPLSWSLVCLWFEPPFVGMQCRS